ncbi:hypothetical protein [Marinobacter subterrani]|uniref:Uncharacterized protein n=1 Tax=Marinobacter subterrani TaxID=1658765 RepID=A0A0J7J5L4_9GAMM|nr:hypothetical protein [Marinobacter subterrani]KMQ72834.1 hypothetical protein Msub_20028 [Marinobacter subterrani]KMQ73858.1 hypothetical protein Msub_10019 [Marinobacter subterrani]KMQ75315.1 hypothetical protein Msub_11517 [Marinobacter subterrani]
MALYFSKTAGGFFDDAIHDNLPADVVEISYEDHATLINGQADGSTIKVDSDGRPYLESKPIPVLADRRKSAKQAIDRAAGQARQRYVSDGQLVEQEYRQALEATKEWRAAGSPANSVPADIQVWADAAGISAEESAQNIEATAAAWTQVLSNIRQIRLSGKAAVDAATDQSSAHDMEVVAQPYIDQLEALKP